MESVTSFEGSYPAQLLRAALIEAREKLDGTWVDLDERLAKLGPSGIGLSCDQLRRYASGLDGVRKKRALLIVRMLIKAGLGGKAVLEAEDQLVALTDEKFGPFSKEELAEMSKDFAALRYADKRAQNGVIDALKKYIRKLAGFELQQHEIAYIALAVVESVVKEDCSGNGGLVDLTRLSIRREGDAGVDHVWFSWSVSSSFSDQT